MKKVSLHFLFIASCAQALAQQNDSLFINSAKTVANQWRVSQLLVEPHLYNGIEYSPYRAKDGEHPYWVSSDWLSGSILYHGQPYYDLELQYDIVNDQLILQNPWYNSDLQLIKQRITSFCLGDKRFINMKHPSLPLAGFYEVLYDGTTQVICRRTKRAWEEVSTAGISQRFKEKSTYYLFVNNQYFLVKNKADVLRKFRNQRKELSSHYRKQKGLLSNEEKIVALAKQFDTIQK